MKDIKVSTLHQAYESLMSDATFEHLDQFTGSWSAIINVEEKIFKSEYDFALQIWEDNFLQFDNIISDIVLMHLHLEIQNYDMVQQIQIHWQKIMDKLAENTILEFYFGLYYYYLGVLYYNLQEYEVSIHHFGKSDSQFIKNDFYYGQYVVQGEIATAMEDLGAYGDARYHLREQLRRDGYIPDTEHVVVNFIKQGEMYMKSEKLDDALKMFKKAEELIVDVEDKGLKTLLLTKFRTLHQKLQNPDLAYDYQQILKTDIHEYIQD